MLIPPGSSATRKCMSPGACEVIGAMCVARRSTIDVSKSVKNASQSMKKIQSLDAFQRVKMGQLPQPLVLSTLVDYKI